MREFDLEETMDLEDMLAELLQDNSYIEGCEDGCFRCGKMNKDTRYCKITDQYFC